MAQERGDSGDNSELYRAEDPFPDVDFVDSGNFAYRGPNGKRKRGKPFYLLITLVLVAILGATSYYFLSRTTRDTDSLKIQGKFAMSEQELRDIVSAKKLTVYWAGPLEDTKYALIAINPGSRFVRYLPKGNGLNDSTTSYRVIATYVQKDAFLVTQSAGGVTGNVGFTNVDGNAVFYVKSRPTNVYMGIKDKDIQIEIYDPGIDQALGLSLIHNQIKQIS
ncbi:MAG: hypothetical protein Q8L08_00335 [Candidatus Nanopelagicaceae bacterium]|nr:hypothetical protein [Candidatus Nanopelagicaceae bacterium]